MNFYSCWHYIFTDYPYLSLKEKGFEVEPISEEIINGLKCNSLLFQKDCFLQELQFRELLDEEEFLNMQKLRKSPNAIMASAHDLLRPGVCFYHDSLNEDFILDGLEVSLCNLKKNKNTIVPKNKNLKVLGLLWCLSEDEADFFCQKTNLKCLENKIKISQGFDIFLADKKSDIYNDFDARKDFSFWAVVVQADDLTSFKRIQDLSDVQTISWENKPAFLIKNHITQWDIIVT
jgi:hypothetical protein